MPKTPTPEAPRVEIAEGHPTAARIPQTFALRDIEVAPENMRFGEPAGGRRGCNHGVPCAGSLCVLPDTRT